jgi:hypothetical protein
MAAYEILRYLGQHVSGQHADVTVNTNPIFEPSEDASDQFTTAASTPRWLESCSSGRSLEAKPDREVKNAKGATSQPRMNGCRGTDASCAQYMFAHSKCSVRPGIYGGKMLFWLAILTRTARCSATILYERPHEVGG